MNRAWHERHPLRKGLDADERLAWHMAHQNACACRPVPAKLLAALGAPKTKKRR